MLELLRFTLDQAASCSIRHHARSQRLNMCHARMCNIKLCIMHGRRAMDPLPETPIGNCCAHRMMRVDHQRVAKGAIRKELFVCTVFVRIRRLRKSPQCLLVILHLKLQSAQISVTNNTKYCAEK